MAPAATKLAHPIRLSLRKCRLLNAGCGRFPDISVGCASCYLRDRFYAEKVFFEGGKARL